MTLIKICIIVSSLSFLFYGISYFTSPHMKNEFKRFGLAKIGIITIIFEFLGAIGLLVGLRYNPILITSSLGLATLMLIGLIVRIRIKDSFRLSLPAIFYLGLNTYILFISIKWSYQFDFEASRNFTQKNAGFQQQLQTRTS